MGRRVLTVVLLSALATGAWAGTWEKDISKAAHLHKKGDLKGAERVLLNTLLGAEAFGEADPRLAYTLDYLGTLNLQMGLPDKASAMFERAVKAFGASRGPDAGETLEATGRLAESYDERSLYAKSEPLYKTLVQSKRGDELQQSVDLNGLAVSQDAQGRQEEALVSYKKALELREGKLGPSAPELPEILNNIARVYYMQGKYADAEPLYERAIGIDEGVLQAGDPQLADDYRRLSVLCKKTGRQAQAEAWESKAQAVDQAAASKASKDSRKKPS
jgi:tetratricopeptide (TPR) repeat protein